MKSKSTVAGRRHQAPSNNPINALLRHIATGFAAVCLMFALCGNAWAEKVNLNAADAEALEYIPGIGPSKARDILAMREAKGGFKSVDELLAVPGIGAKTLEVIMQHGDLDSGVAKLTDEMRQNPPRRASAAKAVNPETTGNSG